MHISYNIHKSSLYKTKIRMFIHTYLNIKNLNIIYTIYVHDGQLIMLHKEKTI